MRLTMHSFALAAVALAALPVAEAQTPNAPQKLRRFDGTWTGKAATADSGCVAIYRVNIVIANGSIDGESTGGNAKNPNLFTIKFKGKVTPYGKLTWAGGGQQRNTKASGQFADGKFDVVDVSNDCTYKISLERSPKPG